IRLATRQPHALVVPAHGRHRITACRRGGVVLVGALAPPRLARQPLLPAVLGRRGATRDPRTRTGLGDNRGGPSTLDGVAGVRTTDAATMDSGLGWSYAGVLILYTGMTVGA